MFLLLSGFYPQAANLLLEQANIDGWRQAGGAGGAEGAEGIEGELGSKMLPLQVIFQIRDIPIEKKHHNFYFNNGYIGLGLKLILF